MSKTKSVVKNYFNRIFTGCKKWELVYWWILRIPMFYIFIKSIIDQENEQFMQVSANLIGMFAWEIMMMLPSKNLLRQIPSYFQDLMILAFFFASFGGYVLNFYYLIPCYDAVLHLICGGGAVWVGYEVFTAMQKRDMKTASVPIVLLGAFGYSMLMCNGWELFEFVFDQYFGGDSQHWSYELAVASGSGIEKGFFDMLYPERFSLMDTMEDMVCNVLGAVIVYIGLKISPYHHNGKNDVNKWIEEQKAEKQATEPEVSFATV